MPTVRSIIEAYELSGRPASDFLADDVEYKIIATGETARGKDAVLEMLKGFYSDSFSEVKTSTRNIAADEEKGLGFIEFTFRGRHTGREFMGIKPAARTVEFPLLNIYEISNGKIRSARLYYDTETLRRQLALGKPS